MSTYLRITRIPYEEPYHLELRVEASNGRQSACFGFYIGAQLLIEIADELEVFPQHSSHVFLQEVGSERPEDRWAYYFRFRVFPVDGFGRCALQLRFNNNQELPHREISEFCIETVPAQINRLGKMFRQFAKLESPVLEWSPSEKSAGVEHGE